MECEGSTTFMVLTKTLFYPPFSRMGGSVVGWGVVCMSCSYTSATGVCLGPAGRSQGVEVESGGLQVGDRCPGGPSRAAARP